ncbi:hypothetical protein SKAU_G00088830 [Synaphobranchus kaupii]|uniref:Uncharacterized protein n=1 Tax=Synaphobranchus kaupii TaxID=118154 RepID=A0A9Q1FW97_SYNKA|nr:hypothetical protein SKAU_G00088830 [Synaphobranchus kaupii]
MLQNSMSCCDTLEEQKRRAATPPGYLCMRRTAPAGVALETRSLSRGCHDVAHNAKTSGALFTTLRSQEEPRMFA